MNVHRLLHKCEFSLQASVLWRLLKSKNTMLLYHPQQSRVDSWPVLSVWLAKNLALRHDGFRLKAHLLLQQHAFLLLFSVASHISHYIGRLLFLLLLLLRVAWLQLTKKQLEFFPIIKARSIHFEDWLPDCCGHFTLQSRRWFFDHLI